MSEDIGYYKDDNINALRRVIGQDIRQSPTAIALIEAGIEQFSLYGEKATTRNVAQKANANIAAIAYYFKNKNGLYKACMHYIVDAIWSELGEHFQSPELLKPQMNKSQAQAFYLTLMDNFCVFFLNDPDTKCWSQFVMREHATPTEAYEIFYERYYRHSQRTKSKLLAICLAKDEHDPYIKILGHALFGQVLGFLVARESLLRGLGDTTLSQNTINMIRKVVRKNVLAVLESA